MSRPEEDTALTRKVIWTVFAVPVFVLQLLLEVLWHWIACLQEGTR